MTQKAHTTIITAVCDSEIPEVIAIVEAAKAAGRRAPRWVKIIHQDDCNCILDHTIEAKNHDCKPVLVEKSEDFQPISPSPEPEQMTGPWYTPNW